MKSINIHQDYILYTMISQLKSQLHIICSYMQQNTPYGDEYKAAFEEFKNLSSEIEKYESLLQECVEARIKGE